MSDNENNNNYNKSIILLLVLVLIVCGIIYACKSNTGSSFGLGKSNNLDAASILKMGSRVYSS
tara:strand:- start:140 stop:328 length:189 start_codon:yes stop_codon:yes gene_type:complete